MQHAPLAVGVVVASHVRAHPERVSYGNGLVTPVAEDFTAFFHEAEENRSAVESCSSTALKESLVS